jgi:hypothetical protein
MLTVCRDALLLERPFALCLFGTNLSFSIWLAGLFQYCLFRCFQFTAGKSLYCARAQSVLVSLSFSLFLSLSVSLYVRLSGADALLDHLSDDDEAKQLVDIGTFASRCEDPRCGENGRWGDTVLPWTLDDSKPLPPLLRVNKLIFSDDVSAITDTLVITTSDNVRVVYKLLAVLYGNASHFTADIRYNLDTGSEQFHHFDPFHFRQDRVLALSENLPACMGGQPVFVPRHTEDMRSAFSQNTTMRNVASAIYGQMIP